MKEYKVYTQEIFTAVNRSVSPTEEFLNRIAREGWRLVNVTNYSFTSLMGEEKQRLTMFLERDIPEKTKSN